MKRSGIFAAVLAGTALLLAGCGNNDAAVKAVVTGQVRSYIEDVSAAKFNEARTIATGGALTALASVQTLFSQASYHDTVSHLSIQITSLDTQHGLATVRASYVLETEIANVGNQVSHPSMVVQLTRLGGAWRIYAINLISE